MSGARGRTLLRLFKRRLQLFESSSPLLLLLGLLLLGLLLLANLGLEPVRLADGLNLCSERRQSCKVAENIQGGLMSTPVLQLQSHAFVVAPCSPQPVARSIPNRNKCAFIFLLTEQSLTLLFHHSLPTEVCALSLLPYVIVRTVETEVL